MARSESPRRCAMALALLAAAIASPGHAADEATEQATQRATEQATQKTTESQCFGTVSRGRLQDGVKLPLSGPNFAAYSVLGASAGRTHVHSAVARVIEASYAALQQAHPDLTYVYGETGWPSGGRFRPHRTHQNGLSVDFFVPVRDARGRSVPVPTALTDRLGYDLEFDAAAKHGDLTIDFEALAEHLAQLHLTAKQQGIGIALVIFDTAYLPRLFATTRGAYLKQHLPFMKGQPWVRHDEHYHVDFAVPCQPEVAQSASRRDM